MEAPKFMPLLLLFPPKYAGSGGDQETAPAPPRDGTAAFLRPAWLAVGERPWAS